MKKNTFGSHAASTAYLRGGVRLLTAFAGTLFVLWLLLYLSAMIPNEAIRSKMEQSALRYRERNAYEPARENQLNSTADHYADVIWLNVAWNVGKGDPLTGSLLTNYYDGEALGHSIGLYLTVTQDAQPNTDYTRYWHGTVLFIRLLHLFTDVEGIKLIGFASFLLLFLFTAGLLVRRRHGDLALLLALSLAAIRIWNIRLSMEYQPAFLVAFAMLPFYLLLEKRGNDTLLILSVISGAAVSFFDFLTTETVCILLPLALVIAVRAKEGRLGALSETLLLLVRCGAGWGMAYVGAFAVKWLAASLVSGSSVLSAVVSSAGFRLGGSMEDFMEPPASFLSALLANISQLFGGPSRVNYAQVFLGTALVLLVLFSVWFLLRGKEKQPHAAALLLLGGLVLVRFLVLNNHSYLHCFFTHRALVTTIFALLASLRLNIGPSQKKKRRRR